MNQYKEYAIEDFVLDAGFQNWARYKRASDEAFWQKYLKDNISQHDDIVKAYTLLESVYRHYEGRIDDSEIEAEIHELLGRVRVKRGNQEPTSTGIYESFRRKKYWVYRVAAILVIAFGIVYLYTDINFRGSTYKRLVAGKKLEEIRNETNTNKTLLLEDGSKVTLGPNSILSFPQAFLGDKREVYLAGEANFQVSKDSKRPFLVYANELVTRVLGTSFTVRAPDSAHKTTVEVKEGKVSVFKQADFTKQTGMKTSQSKGLVLTANQKVVFERANSDMLKTLSDSPEIVLKDEQIKKFEFVNTPASRVLADLQSAYQIDIIFDKELLLECPITALLSRQSLFEKLDIICEVIEARYEIIDGQIVVYSKGCKN